jgi:hypothetical protein
MSNLDACFIVNHWEADALLALRVVEQIQQHHPNTQIIAISDGNWEGVESLWRGVGVDLIIGDRIKNQPSMAGAWIDRYMRAFIDQSKAKYLIRVDADTIMHRPIASIPTADHFGHIATASHPPFVNQGASGYTRSAVKRILGSGLLSMAEYGEPPYLYQRYGTTKRWEWETPSNELFVYGDRVLQSVNHRLSLTVGGWGECLINFREIPGNPDNRWALTHPHPQL